MIFPNFAYFDTIFSLNALLERSIRIHLGKIEKIMYCYLKKICMYIFMSKNMYDMIISK